MHKAKQSAFTLIELLVVVSIIALLVSILLPALGRARDIAKRTVCVSRLKDLGSATMMYSLDFDDRMVPNSVYRYRWWDILGSYMYDMKRTSDSMSNANRENWPIFMCPESERLHTNFKANQSPESNDMMYGYKLNNNWMNPFGYNYFFACTGIPMGDTNLFRADPQFKYRWHSKLNNVTMPATLPLFWCANTRLDLFPTIRSLGFDGYPGTTFCKYGWADDVPTPSKGNFCNVNGPAANHGDKNLVFMHADAHVASAGAWIYEDTMNDPSDDAATYFSFFHPRRSRDPLNSVGDAWPGDRTLLEKPYIE